MAEAARRCGAPAGGVARIQSRPDLGWADRCLGASCATSLAVCLCLLPLLPSPSSRPLPVLRWLRTPGGRACEKVAALLRPGGSRRWKPRASTLLVVADGAGWCPSCDDKTSLPGVVLLQWPSSPTQLCLASNSLQRSLFFCLGEIPERWEPALSTATPEGAVTFLKALA
jgi:hypothetical protein